MMWSEAMAMWVAPSWTSVSVEPTTPAAAA